MRPVSPAGGINRRAVLAGAAASALVPREAATQTRRARIGIATAESAPTLLGAFLQELEALGWRSEINLELLMANAEGDPSRLPAIIADLVARGPEVIVSASGRTHLALRSATTRIPVVTVSAIDPLNLGLSDSLSQPSRNFTGNTGFVEELMGKRVQLLREALPRARRIALLLDPANPGFPATHRETTVTADRLGFTVEVAGFGSAREVLPAVESAKALGADALIVVPDVIALPQMAAIAARAEALALPSIGFNESDLQQGLTFALGGDRALLWRSAARTVDRLLRGTRVADLPFERPTKVFMGVNMRVARRLGIDVPMSILASADEVIE